MEQKKAYIILANGMVIEGVSFGAAGTKIGEIVFNTGMVGYQETLTDPAYYGQIVMQTYPLAGNYGVNAEDAESDRVWPFGYIVREVCDAPSNFRCQNTLDAYMKENNVIGVCGVDTRSLTRLLRENGVMNGAVTTEYSEATPELLEQIRAYSIQNAVDAVTTSSVKEYNPEGGLTVALMDYGVKRSVIKNLTKRGCRVVQLPANADAQQVQAVNPDGILLSNGPGNPEENAQRIDNLRRIAALGKPIFGISLGHQLVALAAGAKVQKLKCGHHGANQPVTDTVANTTCITGQNHIYAVAAQSVHPAVAQISHVNANDGTVEGLIYKNVPCFTIQFEPTANGGPQNPELLYDEFIARMAQAKGAC